MSFATMRKALVKEGFLDKDGKLTHKGHEYVETTKRDLKAKTQAKGEEIDRATRETERILDQNDGSDGGAVRGRTAHYANVSD